GAVNGARFRLLVDPVTASQGGTVPFPAGDYIVLLYGDLILANTLDPKTKRFLALDANHLNPGLSGAGLGLGRRCPTGDGVEGGTFRGGFTVSVRVVTLNTAT